MKPNRTLQRGFTLIEILIAAALLTALTVGVFQVVRGAIARQEAAALDSESRATLREILDNVRNAWKARVGTGVPFVALAAPQFNPVGATPCQALQINQLNSVGGVISPGLKTARFSTQCSVTQTLPSAHPDLNCPNAATVQILTTRPGVPPALRQLPARLEGISIALCFRVGPPMGGAGNLISVEAGAVHRGRAGSARMIETLVLSTNDRQAGIEFFE